MFHIKKNVIKVLFLFIVLFTSCTVELDLKNKFNNQLSKYEMCIDKVTILTKSTMLSNIFMDDSIVSICSKITEIDSLESKYSYDSLRVEMLTREYEDTGIDFNKEGYEMYAAKQKVYEKLSYLKKELKHISEKLEQYEKSTYNKNSLYKSLVYLNNKFYAEEIDIYKVQVEGIKDLDLFSDTLKIAIYNNKIKLLDENKRNIELYSKLLKK